MATLRSREDVGRRLLVLKGEIEKQKARRARLQGELDATLRQLKQDYGVTSVDEGMAKIEEEEKALQKMWEGIEKQLDELEELLADG
jgi:chromosome segregation ATPase